MTTGDVYIDSLFFTRKVARTPLRDDMDPTLRAYVLRAREILDAAGAGYV